MCNKLTVILVVATIFSIHFAGLGDQLKLQDKQLIPPDAQVVSTQIAKTEYSQLEVILKSDGTWEFEDTYLNYSRRDLLPYKILIPEGYVGWISIHYGVEDAPPLRIEDGYIIIRVPPSGKLKTSSLLGYSYGELDNSSGNFDYSGNKLTPIKVEKFQGWGDPQLPPLSDNERTILASSFEFGGDREMSYGFLFFVGTASQLREYGEDRTDGSTVPLAPEVENYWYNSAVTPSTAIFLTSEDTQTAFTKTGRAVTLETDAKNYRTWNYAEAEPVVPSDSVLNTELSQAIKEAIKLLEAHENEAFWRRFWNPYLRNTGYEHARPKDKPIDIVESLIKLHGSQERFDKMSQEDGKKLLESLHKIQDSQPVYRKIEYSKNIMASFFEDGEKNPDLKEKQASVPFVRVGQSWYICFR